MCLGLPGRITAVRDAEPLRMGDVAFAGVRREVCLAYVPEAAEGDWVIVHAGFAISVVDEEQAQVTLELAAEALEAE